MYGGTGIRTRGPGTAAGLRFSSFHRIGTTRRLEGYKTSHENLPKLASVIGRRFWLAPAEGLSLVCGQCPSLLGGGADLDCLRCGCACDAVLGGCDFDEPGAGLFEANRAGGGAFLGFLVGGDFAGAARGSGGASLEASGHGRGGGDFVGHP